MARFSKKKFFLFVIPLLGLVLAGGYFASTAVKQGSAEAPDSTGDSTAVAEADGKKGKKGKKDKDEKKEPDPVPVEIATVNPREISSYYYTTAALEPEKKVDLIAKINGQIEEIYVEEGDVVKKGAVLVQIEDAEQRVRMDEARINRDQEEREFERLRGMHEQKLISDTEFSTRKHQFELAENKFFAAKVRYRFTKVRAPFGGVITKRHVDVGQNLTVGAPLFEIVDTKPLLVRMYLPENEVQTVRIGQAVSIEPDNEPGRVLEGRIVRIAPEVDQRTGTVKVTAETRGRAMPGSFVRIRIVTDTRQGTLTIPRKGLVSNAGELYVFVAEADSVRKTSVQIGYQDRDFAEVLDGIAQGDSVVVVGMGGLRTGTKVRVLDATMQDALSRDDEDVDAIPASN